MFCLNKIINIFNINENYLIYYMLNYRKMLKFRMS
jgi:hypothetical protein